MPDFMLVEKQPAIYRFELGSFEITGVKDGKVIREGLIPSYGGAAFASAVQALERANRIGASR